MSISRIVFLISTDTLPDRQYGNSSTITAAPPSVTAIGTGDGGMTSSCGGCYWQNIVNLFTWQTAFTHTAATVLTIIDDSHNTTKTSTINVSNFTVPKSLQYLETGMNNVRTYNYSGTNYPL